MALKRTGDRWGRSPVTIFVTADDYQQQLIGKLQLSWIQFVPTGGTGHGDGSEQSLMTVVSH